MRWTRWAASTMVLCGCQDITFDRDDEPALTPNPPDLEDPIRTDVVVQHTKPKVDVLWVIDDSGSMDLEQRKLTESFDAFMAFFEDSGLDWHIGVTTTDTSVTGPGKRGELRLGGGLRYLTDEVSDPVGRFRELALVGISGSGDERGLQAAQLALTDPLRSTQNSGFYRDDAALHVIVISDEDDQSHPDPTQSEFVSWMRALKASPEDASFSAITGPLSGCSSPDGLAFGAPRYLATVEATGGLFASICSDDWVPLLEDLGLRASGLQTVYHLQEVPVVETIEVWVDDGDYTYLGDRIEALGMPADCGEDAAGSCFGFVYLPEPNAILLDGYVPGPLAEVNIRYVERAQQQTDGAP